MSTFNITVGSASLAISALGPNDAEHSELETWSLGSLQRQEDVQENYPLARAVSERLYGMNVREAFAPNVAAMSGTIVSPQDLIEKICLGEVSLYRNKQLPADGVLLNPGETFIMSAAGCPIILASGGDHFIASHAGRDSLIDRGAVNNSPTRRHMSIVNAMIHEFRLRKVPITDVVMVMLFAIPADTFEHSFDHPQYGGYNRALYALINARWPKCARFVDNRMFLDLESLFIEQALSTGVPRMLSAICSLAEFPHLAHTRDGIGANRRNLIVVRRDS